MHLIIYMYIVHVMASSWVFSVYFYCKDCKWISNVVDLFSLWQEGPRKDGCSPPGLVCNTSWEAPWGEGPRPCLKEKCERTSKRWVQNSVKWGVDVPCCLGN